MSVIMFFGVLKYKPFEKKVDNYFTLIVEFLYVMLFSVMLYMHTGGMDSSQKYDLLGNMAIALIIIIILVHIGLGIILLIESIKDVIKYCKNYGKLKKESN